MRIILVMAASHAHFRHWSKCFVEGKDMRFIFINDYNKLLGMRPSGIVLLPEWTTNKPDAFIERVEFMIKDLEASRGIDCA